MRLQIWRPWLQLTLAEEHGIGARSPWEYSLLALYALLAVAVLAHCRRDFSKLVRYRRRSLLFVALAVASVFAGNLLVLHVPPYETLSFPASVLENSRWSVPLVGSLPVFAAAAWLGAGPAMLIGSCSGVFRADVTTGGLADPFYFVFLGAGIGLLLRQDYGGGLPKMARQPILLGVLLAPMAMLPLLLSISARMAPLGLSGLEYAVSLTQARVIPVLLESWAAAAVIQVIYVVRPGLLPVQTVRQGAPYARSMNRRFLTVVVPLVLVATGVLITAVTVTTIRVAKAQAVREMAQDAYSAAQAIPQFIRTGQALVTEFASDDRLLQYDAAALQSRLMHNLREDAFFDQMLLFDVGGQLLAMYPPAPTGDPHLTAEEEMLLERVLLHGTLQISPAHRSTRSEALISFLAPVGAMEGEVGPSSFGALVGRTHLDINPLITRILVGLQWSSGLSEGLVIDEHDRIVAHSNPEMLLTEWRMGKDDNCTRQVPRGQLCASRDPARPELHLTYYLATEGYPWTVVVRLPYAVVLDEAWQIARPLLALQALFGVGLVFGVFSVTRRLTQPLEQLAEAADRIAGGDLANPVEVTSDDEVGRVGHAFDDMRLRLKDRMSDLSLLLEVSRAVSSTLELPRGIPFILEGALEATGGQLARGVFFSEEGDPEVVMSTGDGSDADICAEAQALDGVLAKAAKARGGPVLLGDLARAKALVDLDTVNGPIKAVIALPVRTSDQTLAVVWVGYRTVQQFRTSKVNFLSTLASQTAVLLENARLFQAVEGERRKLSALLDSISDAVVVTDQEGRILLVNPAVEREFGVEADAVVGRRADQAGLNAELVQALTKPTTPGEALIEPTPLPDGRALYVNVSTIVNPDGQPIGRVAVMRDVSRFRQLDQMKSDFLATVSHDLRAPLTFMRGYTHRLGAAGALNEKQREHVDNIVRGIERIDSLVTDLLDLGRIEAGLGLEREPCHLGVVLAEAVKGMEARADAKDISLRMKIPPVVSEAGNGRKGDVTVAGDVALLRQVVVNLLDNAIKYTPRGGHVTVELSIPEDNGDRAVISVVDTGVGIAPDEQIRLFEKFYRVKRGAGSDLAGTGLGLALVKSIV
ncbi:MAG: histidine kinase dimerization/phospho-acceptor domain-containing protein, partial [Anaerolineae bacterium]